MGARSRSKGRRAEQQIVVLARQCGLPAERTWHLAQSPDPMVRCCDLTIAGQPYQVQVSRDGFERIYRELEGVRGFIFRLDRCQWLIALRLDDYLELLKRAALRPVIGLHRQAAKLQPPPASCATIYGAKRRVENVAEGREKRD